MVLCEPDFPFVQDGTRQDESFRLEQHAWYLRELERRQVRYLTASGDPTARLAAVLRACASTGVG